MAGVLWGVSVMIYLATPIAHENPAIVSFRISTANRAACTLHDADIPVFSPASHSRTFSSLSCIQQPWSYWERIDIPILTTCCTHLVVLCMEGWEKSVGVQAEIRAAGEAGLLLTYISHCQCGERLSAHRICDGPARPDLSAVLDIWSVLEGKEIPLL